MLYSGTVKATLNSNMHLPLYPVVQVVPANLSGPAVLSVPQALKDQSSHNTQYPPAKHDKDRKSENSIKIWY